MTRRLPNVVRNAWQRDTKAPILVARILEHHTSPEGLDVERIRFLEASTFALDAEVGHFVNVLSGVVNLWSASEGDGALQLSVSTHTYIPAGWGAQIQAPAGAELLRVSGGTSGQARGTRLLVRDEAFLAACATESESLRWVLTSQYLSRRIFLQHDETLLSKSGAPVSWFRTTMFDISGLPPNADGEPVFKMQYDSRTEFNVCYDVSGQARVRMAEHPYRETGQSWRPWLSLDGDSTYHVNEALGGDDQERKVDPTTGEKRVVQNKHEVHIQGGQVTLFCLFDPAPAGFERHRPGSYSDYEPLPADVGSKRQATYLRDLARFDEMVDVLSLARVRGQLDALRGSSAWQLYARGREAQVEHESALIRALASQGDGRDLVVAPWTTISGKL